MNKNSMKKMLSVIGVFVLIAAMALNFTGCGSKPTQTQPAEGSLRSFRFVVVDGSGKETSQDIQTTCTTVGDALLEKGYISGEDGPYGLYIKTVNGITADYDTDGTYWGFYINDEYAATGVDVTEIEEGATYTLKVEGASPAESAAAESDISVIGEGNTVFYFTAVDLEGAESKFEIHTDAATVGAALIENGLISGDDGEYGLYVKTVNGITLDWDKDGKYWSLLIDGEYAMTGVDDTEITSGATYTFLPA